MSCRRQLARIRALLMREGLELGSHDTLSLQGKWLELRPAPTGQYMIENAAPKGICTREIQGRQSLQNARHLKSRYLQGCTSLMVSTYMLN
jgi:hypothetical protein